MPVESSTSILIAGAGPTGLTLAIDLARRNIPFRLIDAAPVPFAGSRAKGLQPRTLEVFEDLGMIDAVLAAGAPYPRMRIHAGPFSLRGGSLGASLQPSEAIPYPNLWMVPQSQTEEILRDRLHELGGQVEFGTALISFTQDQDSIHATLSSGDTIETQYLIGCDGARSVVRKTLGLHLIGETIQEKSNQEKLHLVADLEINGLDRNDWHIWPFVTGGPIGICPLPGTNLFQLMASASVEPNLDAIIQRTTGLSLTRIAWSSTYRLQARMVEHYQVGRVFLAGDAAHVHPPAGGQGLNTGVQDAYNLGWKLAWVLKGGPREILETYEAERLPIAAAVLGLTKRLALSRSLKRGDATNQLALHYRSSVLSEGTPLGSLHPGDRMPDKKLTDGTRLFEQMRGPHATLVVTPDEKKILIRPDGYIASISSTGITEYAGLPIYVARADPAHSQADQ